MTQGIGREEPCDRHVECALARQHVAAPGREDERAERRERTQPPVAGHVVRVHHIGTDRANQPPQPDHLEQMCETGRLVLQRHVVDVDTSEAVARHADRIHGCEVNLMAHFSEVPEPALDVDGVGIPQIQEAHRRLASPAQGVTERVGVRGEIPESDVKRIQP